MDSALQRLFIWIWGVISSTRPSAGLGIAKTVSTIEATLASQRIIRHRTVIMPLYSDKFGHSTYRKNVTLFRYSRLRMASQQMIVDFDLTPTGKHRATWSGLTDE